MSTTLEPTREATAPARSLTPDDLLSLPNGKDYELVDGLLVERNMSFLGSLIAVELITVLRTFCKTTGVAWVLDAECGYLGLGRGNTVRKPDVSVVLRDRLPGGTFPEGWAPFAPDIAAEVVSPNDTVYELERKVREYLDGGVRLVWVIHPETRMVRVQRPDGTVSLLREADTLHGEEVLPGFSCLVAELFPPVASVPETESAS